MCLSLFIGCSDGGGGVTSEPPGPTTPTEPEIPPVRVFNKNRSELIVKNSANITITDNGTIGDTYKLILIARDQFGDPLSGLTFKLGLEGISAYENIVVSESSTPGQYELSFVGNMPGLYLGYMKIDNDTELDYTFMVSFCNSPSQPSASPFHSQITYGGTQYYVICSVPNLVATKDHLNESIILGKDLDLTDYYIDANSDTIPDNQFLIGSSATPFTGEFYGSNFSINGYKYIAPTEDDVGLFSVIGEGATIRSLFMSNSEVRGSSNVGILVGRVVNNGSNETLIEKSSSYLNIVSGLNNVGGVVGHIETSTAKVKIDNSQSNVLIDIDSLIGTKSRIGGVVGFNEGGSLIDLYSNQTFSYTGADLLSKVGGVVGENVGVAGSVFDNISFYITQSYTKASQIGCVFGEVSNSTITNVGSGSLCSIDQNGSIMGDITFSGGLFGSIQGSTLSQISGYVDAQGIVNNFGGLAEQVLNTTLSDVQLAGSLNSTSNNLGGLVANSVNSSYSSIVSYVSINTSTAGSGVGGIIGNGSYLTLDKVGSYASVLAPNASYVGGIIGYATGELALSNSFNASLIVADSIVGGLVGEFYNDSFDKSISKSYSSGAITANSSVGGLVGILGGATDLIEDSFSTSPIQTASNGVPTNSGSIVGEKHHSGSVDSNNYYLSSATKLTDACGTGTCVAINTDTGAGEAVDILYYSDSANQPFLNWDIINTWVINPPYLPYFR